MQTKAIEFNGFVKAFGTYNRYRRILRHILKDTNTLLQNNSIPLQGNYEFNLQDHCLSEAEYALVSNTISNTLCFIVLGQSYKVKCQLINKLFGQTIIPVDTDWIKSGKTIVFKYGQKPQLSVALPDSFVIVEAEFENCKTAKENCQKWKEEFKLLENDIKEVEHGLVEISVHHSLLKGSKVILCGESSTNYDSVLENITTCTKGSMPLFLYALENLPLTEHDQINLKILSKHFLDSAVFFSHFIEESENFQPCRFGNKHCGNKHNNLNDKIRNILGNKENEIVTRRHTISCPEIQTLTDVAICSDLCNNKILLGLNNERLNVSANGNSMIKPCKCLMPMSTSFDVNQSVLSSKVTSSGDCIVHNIHNCSCLNSLLEAVKLEFECTCKRNCFKSENKPAEANQIVLDFENETKTVQSTLCSQNNTSYVSCNASQFDDNRLQNFAVYCFFTHVNHPKFQSKLLTFIRNMAKYYLIRPAKILNTFHSQMLDKSIDFAFELIRDLSITPRRVEYVRQKEFQLYFQLRQIVSKNQSEIQSIIESAKIDLHDSLLSLAESYEISTNLTNAQIKLIKRSIQELVLLRIKTHTAEKLNKSIQILRESFVGTLLRCLSCLESSNGAFTSVEGEDCASRHFTKILNTAYNVQVNVQSSLSVVSVVMDKLRQIIVNLSSAYNPAIDKSWKRNVAEEVLRNLSPKRLAKHICSQFQTRLNQSHSAFLNSLRHLELSHKCRLDNMEGSRYKVARVIAPSIAKLALESTSLIDGVLYGMPRMGREIGRGMYGVVYSCENWGLLNMCAVKSVAPPDEKHFNDLSLEFYYTRKLPPHPRLVQIHGSIIDESYNNGIGPPAVLLIMDRLHRDLYTSIKIGMSLCERLQVAVDVVEGIRFLHSQGLVHRDIKLKNVLLDHKGRAKITDLGFCKPGAMISGSIVGTPIHMPPELFSGNYSFSVDVYAFGILMWYLMAGTTRLPKNFELCTTKDHLWTAVRKGIRPERLPEFSNDIWELMQSCWARNPDDRPLLGNVEPKLKSMHVKSLHFSPK